ncbi:DNA-directed RNA polymerase subunit alpha [Candidatus Nomurabacteria bacterium]|nr:DNA-directed RNA polymerase subunit alpha [Candidatus Nomurabacteria bacterium]MCB9820678.1 DNA-directed RNA polymerase subunit alpha [Candidatus Nomurabacteria bacterium]
MHDNTILLPARPKMVEDSGNKAVFEIDNLYPGYGHTLGNSLRRIILSSLAGAAITSVKINGVDHEFSTIDGVKEDVITMLLNLKKVRFAISSGEEHEVTLKVKGPKMVTASDISAKGQIEVLSKDTYICEITDKTDLDMTITVMKGKGFVQRDNLHKDKVEIGVIPLDAVFSPIKRVFYEVENMRVGDRTDYNRLRIGIETDGSVTPLEALEKSIKIMIEQLHAIIPMHEIDLPEPEVITQKETKTDTDSSTDKADEEDVVDVMKTRIDSVGFSNRTLNALSNANIRTLGGLARKNEEDLLEIEGIGDKGVQEIVDILKEHGVAIK